MLLPGQVPAEAIDNLSMADRIDAESIELEGIALENGKKPDTNGKVHILVIWVNCRQTIEGLLISFNRA